MKLPLLTALVLVAAGCSPAPVPAPVPEPEPPAARDAASADRPPASADPRADARLRACPALADMDVESGRICTQIGCLDGLRIELDRDGPWPAGRYRFDLELDGEPVTCEGELPLAPCGATGVTCSDPEVRVAASGCDRPPAEHAFTEIAFGSRLPQTVEVTIEHDGSRLAADRLRPTYRASQPNGPGCGPLCCQASERLS